MVVSKESMNRLRDKKEGSCSAMEKAAKRVKRHLKPLLIILYIGVVLIPGAVLGVLALRALDREEAYVEKTLSNSLLSEVTQTVSTVQNELEALREELGEIIDFSPGETPYLKAPFSPGKTPLIDAVFALSEKREILWPNEMAALNEQEKEFLYWNAPLILDRVEIPVVKNIVSEYKDKILPEAPNGTDQLKTPTATTTNKPSPMRTDETINTGRTNVEIPLMETSEETGALDRSLPLEADGFTAGDADLDDLQSGLSYSINPSVADTTTLEKEKKAATTSSSSSASTTTQKSLLEDTKAKREAAEIFQNSPPIQEKIYKQAEEEGKELLTRNILPTAKTYEADSGQRSLFIVTSHTFSHIIAEEEEGFIPRFLGDQFSLLYWKKTATGIIGCVVNTDALKEQILSRLPDTTTAARVLVVLEDTGNPLQAPQDLEIDWRLPFVSREIHETLPRWEVAVYLADPSYISSKAEATTSVIWVLTGFLLFAIAGGGVILIKMLLSELSLAQKKTNLVTNVSHELKTPLTSIRLFAEMLMSDVVSNKKKRMEYCSMLVSETERLSRLINNVLDFSKISQGKKHYDKKDIDLVALIREIIQREKVRLEQQEIVTEFKTRFKKLPFYGCRESLTQVMINLFSNAEKYAREGGEIDISLEKKDRTIVILVADRGPGIPAWAAKRIFREFFRVDDSLTARTSGSGLGLPIVRMIVRDHGGDIEYLPRDGGGSVFRISFPERRKS